MEPANKSADVAHNEEYYNADEIDGGEGFEPIDFEHYYPSIKEFTFETEFLPLSVAEGRAILAVHQDVLRKTNFDYSTAEETLAKVCCRSCDGLWM